jgi:multimeric flavodoxin WrbA
LCITKLNALFLVGTLKSGSDASKNSNTYALSEFLAKHLESIEVQSDCVPLANYNILPGVYTNVDNDDWPMIFEKILASDIVIFATPV